MNKFVKFVISCLVTLSLGMDISSQQETKIFNIAKPTGKITISPAEPTTKDIITFTVEAQDNSMTGLKRIVLLVNDKEVKACLRSPCVYRGGPYPEGFLSYGAKAYDHTDNDPWTDFRKVYVEKATRPTPYEKKDEAPPGGMIHLMPLAEHMNTKWANGYVSLTFPGEEGDLRGFACYRYDSLLEDDEVYSQVLLTHPEQRDVYGLIVGIFKIENLPEKATFKAKIGFLKEANHTDGAVFKVFVNGDPSFYSDKSCYYDRHLDDLSFSLDRYANQDVEIVLQVHVLNSSAQDLAVWADPRIEW